MYSVGGGCHSEWNDSAIEESLAKINGIRQYQVYELNEIPLVLARGIFSGFSLSFPFAEEFDYQKDCGVAHGVHRRHNPSRQRCARQ